MKRPQQMTMRELTALPIVDRHDLSEQSAAPIYALPDSVYGGAFADDQGHAWGTLLQTCGWVRYPLKSQADRHPRIAAPAVKAIFSSLRAPLRLHA